MSTAFYHRPHHARVHFDGRLTWDAALDLVETLNTVVDQYHYDAVELVITSPGGDTDALRHVLTALRERQADGVSFQTRVLSFAASAAGVLATAGDFRSAAHDAKFLFHAVRQHREDALTAETARAVLDHVSHVDQWLLGELLVGALLTRSRPPREARADPCDRPVLEALWRVVAPRRRRIPAAVDVLAKAVCDHVERAVEAEDAAALCRLYAAILPVETPISAALACTLRLIDYVGTVPGPASVAVDDEPSLVVPEWRKLFPPDGVVPRNLLARHALILGETGSGKTCSAILPSLSAFARADVSVVGATLVIDPKRELLPALEALAPGRVRRVQTERLALNVMAGPRWSLADDLAAGRWLTAAYRVLSRAASFVPMSAARVLLPHAATGEANAEFFDREGTALAQCVLALVLLLLVRDASEDRPRIGTSTPVGSWLLDVRARAEAGWSALALTAWALTSSLIVAPGSSSWLFACVVDAVIAKSGDRTRLDEAQELRTRVLGYWHSMSKIDRQFAGVLAAAVNAVVDFARPSCARALYVGCEPGYRESDHRLDLAVMVSPRTAHGAVLVVQPARDDADHLVTVALKARFFEAVLDDPDRAGAGAGRPLIGYVADEFHRFVTSDPVHGEQSYLDSCRSFGGCCVLATQSAANIEHALAHGTSPSAATDAAMSILWTNTATKMIFRTTDPDTVRRVEALCPEIPGLVSVVRARPLSGLQPGACVASLADGRFERCQLQPFTSPEAARSPRRAPEASAARPHGASAPVRE